MERLKRQTVMMISHSLSPSVSFSVRIKGDSLAAAGAAHRQSVSPPQGAQTGTERLSAFKPLL